MSENILSNIYIIYKLVSIQWPLRSNMGVNLVDMSCTMSLASISWTLMTMTTQLNPALRSSDNFGKSPDVEDLKSAVFFLLLFFLQQKHMKRQKHEQKTDLDLKKHMTLGNVHSKIVSSMISTNSCFSLSLRAQLHHVFQGLSGPYCHGFWLENVQLKPGKRRWKFWRCLKKVSFLKTNGPWRGIIFPSYMGIMINGYKDPY